jgi:hypothetical protein
MELYFCLHLTENEHHLASWDIQDKCKELGLEFNYYRKLKDGHVPMYREVKVCGTRTQIGKFKNWMASDGVWLDKHVERNPHKVTSSVPSSSSQASVG